VFSSDSALVERLKRLQRWVRVGIVGAGLMGRSLFYQICMTPGVECVALCDLDIEKAIECANRSDRPNRVVLNDAEMSQAFRDGFLAICRDGASLARSESVDVVVEATGSVIDGGKISITAIRNRKHLIMINAEADLIFGPYLARLADQNHVVYSTCDGDQPAVTKRLIDDIRLWGFEVVMAGNIKGFLDRRANPENITLEADKRNLDYRAAAAMTDGTKLCIEMALIANSSGYTVLCSGMRGPVASHVSDTLRLFDFQEIRRQGRAVVDYVLGAEPGGGVFVVGHCDDQHQRSMLSYYKMGSGPFYLFYRPYHLCHIEAVATVAEAHLDGRALMQPRYGFQTNVYAYAKRDLKKGEELDGIGGFTCYGLIEDCEDGGNVGLPICLAEGVALNREIEKDEKISFQDVVYDPTRFDFVAYRKAIEMAREDAAIS
jgi:predicted homoserine dehydrogenase-like protein